MVIAVTPETRQNDFYERVERQSLRPLWLGRDPPPEPSRSVRPWLWPWSLLRPNMLEAAEIMPVAEDGGADRRVLTMINPTHQGRGATRTLLAAVQLVQPGERAPSHRHSPAALRFIIEGQGGYTIVEGEPLTMEPGDFLLTPSWTWHGHGHDGSGPMLWLDVLDVPLVSALDVAFHEEFAHPRQLQPSQKEADATFRLLGTGAGVVPTWMGRPEVPYSPLFTFKYAATREALGRLTQQEPSPYEGYALRYMNPFTGGPVMPTIGATIHLLTRGLRTQGVRSTTNAIYHVVEGSGSSVLDGQRFDWQRGDTFCVPAWCWSEHAASESTDAVLFAASDRPAIESLGLYREQRYPELHQEVTSEFSPPV
jgi:gentisate 1,2-dioxygenase